MPTTSETPGTTPLMWEVTDEQTMVSTDNRYKISADETFTHFYVWHWIPADGGYYRRFSSQVSWDDAIVRANGHNSEPTF